MREFVLQHNHAIWSFDHYNDLDGDYDDDDDDDDDDDNNNDDDDDDDDDDNDNVHWRNNLSGSDVA